jgi:hypothetical protein
MPITEFCIRDVVCGSRDTFVADAATLMRRRHVGNVIVIDQIDGKRVPVGIVTDRDIVVEVVAAGLDPKLIKLGRSDPRAISDRRGKCELRRNGSSIVYQGRSPDASCGRSRWPGRNHYPGRHAAPARGAVGGAFRVARA